VIKKVVQIKETLAKRYGVKSFDNRKDPLSELIFTVLSQNTTDINRDRAYESLKRSYPTWEDVAKTSSAKLASTIKVGGLAKIKAVRILKMLRDIKNTHGHLNLGFLNDWTDNRIRDYLMKINGVGPKTAACVLAFSLSRNVMPVDTHVRRVSTRLGILPAKTSDRTAHEYFGKFMEFICLYQFHLNLIEHGRKVCRARKPLCDKCFLKRSCNYYSEKNDKGRTED